MNQKILLYNQFLILLKIIPLQDIFPKKSNIVQDNQYIKNNHPKKLKLKHKI